MAIIVEYKDECTFLSIRVIMIEYKDMCTFMWIKCPKICYLCSVNFCTLLDVRLCDAFVVDALVIMYLSYRTTLTSTETRKKND